MLFFLPVWSLRHDWPFGVPVRDTWGSPSFRFGQFDCLSESQSTGSDSSETKTDESSSKAKHLAVANWLSPRREIPQMAGTRTHNAPENALHNSEKSPSIFRIEGKQWGSLQQLILAWKFAVPASSGSSTGNKANIKRSIVFFKLWYYYSVAGRFQGIHLDLQQRHRIPGNFTFSMRWQLDIWSDLIAFSKIVLLLLQLRYELHWIRRRRNDFANFASKCLSDKYQERCSGLHNEIQLKRQFSIRINRLQRAFVHSAEAIVQRNRIDRFHWNSYLRSLIWKRA